MVDLYYSPVVTAMSVSERSICGRSDILRVSRQLGGIGGHIRDLCSSYQLLQESVAEWYPSMIRSPLVLDPSAVPLLSESLSKSTLR